jgi:hypothetical protein
MASQTGLSISPFGGLSISPLSLARGIAIFFGGLGLFMGGRAIIYPSAYSITFGFSPSSPTTKSADTNPFILVAGGRAVASALGTLACVYLGYNEAVGMMLMVGGVVEVVDGLSVVKYSSKEESKEAMQAAWGHWGVVGFAVAVGG